MLVVLAGSPCTAPLKSSLGEKTQAEVPLIYLVGEVASAVTVFGGCGRLDEAGTVLAVFVVWVIERIDVYSQPSGMF